ncbi:MAG: DNA polymerase III subunit gamma/tau [Candidatus Omnitrophica bacterium]|nr:DNA polymerase III subunit gamma/tau [Candidatus Omnitrophota bacterium]
MGYLPFARKWRPQDFDEIVGQEHITTTLKNAISMDRLHHAYLFTGPRGIGKTSTARIFSKALNCEKGSSIKPCNACSSCKEITLGSSMDVIEIDGASNRGIDEIRNLRETVKFSPSKGRFKIYIIDEVHMLTTEAFNALLKTLEEPPMHVKFIFATTEPHKVLPTVLSRCQRFDFRRIQMKDIIAKLREVSKIESLNIDEDAFLYIAKASDGSMRDAESILDQIASFSKGKIQLKEVIESLGMIDQETLFRSAELIINKDARSGIYLVDEILNSGKDAKQFILGLLEHFRNVMIVKSGIVSDEIINLPKDSIDRIKKQADALTQGDIFYIISVISSGLKMIKQLLPERIVFELLMIKLASRESIASIEEILSKLQDAGPGPGVNETQKLQPSHLPVHKSETKSVSQEKTFFKKILQISNPSPLAQNNDVQSLPSIDMARVKNAWPILVKAMAVKRMSISSYLAEGEPDSVKGNSIIIGFPKELNFHREVLEEKYNKDAIEQALSQIMDMPVKMSFVATDKKPKESAPDANNMKEELKNKEPVIDSALNIFGGRIFKSTKNN